MSLFLLPSPPCLIKITIKQQNKKETSTKTKRIGEESNAIQKCQKTLKNKQPAQERN